MTEATPLSDRRWIAEHRRGAGDKGERERERHGEEEDMSLFMIALCLSDNMV